MGRWCEDSVSIQQNFREKSQSAMQLGLEKTDVYPSCRLGQSQMLEESTNRDSHPKPCFAIFIQ